MHPTLRKSAIGIFLGVQLLAAAALAQTVGRIDFASGIVRIERGAQILAGVRNTELIEGDVIVTGPETQVQVRMTDDAFLALRPNSRLTLDKYRFNRAREEDGVVLSLANGILRAFTGAIAARDRERFVMKTPLATVGIRGSGNILAHLGDEGTVNHTITGAHSVTALDELGRLVTVVTRPGQTVQVRPGAPPRFIPTPSYIFAAASTAPPSQLAAATSSSTTSGGGGSGSGGGDASASGSPSSGGSGSSSEGGDTSSGGAASASSPSGGSSSTTSSGAGSTTTGGGSATTSGLPGGMGASTGASSSPSSNVQTAVAPVNVRSPGGGSGSGPGGNLSIGVATNVINPTGGRAALFATDQDPGYSSVSLDAAGFFTGANYLDYRSVPGAPHDDNNLVDATIQVRAGTGSDYFRNVEQTIALGRLQDASIDVTGVDCCGTTIARTDAHSPASLVFVAYNETPLGIIRAYTGTVEYRLDGATRPADARGNLGTLNSATLRANFTDQQLDFAFSLSVNNLVYSASAGGVYFDRARFSIHHDGGPTNPGLNVSCSGGGCASAYRGGVNGAFAGDGTTAWLAYHLFPADASDIVNGAIAFSAITVPQPRFQLPATGLWTMVLIDNYPSAAPGFPAFSTAANANINFTTRRADFNFTLDRILTPADVAAGFQAQRVTASAANLPIQGVGFVAQTAGAARPSTLNVTCTGCGTAPPVGRFEGYLSYVAPNQLGGNVNIYWYLTNNTAGTLGYDYASSSYFGNVPGTIAPTVAASVALSPAPIRLTRLPEAIRGPLRPPR